MPNNWKKYKLDDVVKIVDSLHKTPTYSTIGLPMVRVQNIDGGFMKLDGCIPVSQQVFNEFSRNHKSQKGDLVFSRVGAYSGKASIVKEDLNFCLGQNTAFIIPQDVNSEFLFYLINSAEIQNSLNLSAVVSSYKTISLKSLKELEITLPSNPEQQSIAEILSSLDDKIELNLQTNKTLEEMANTLYKHWFVDFGPFQKGKFFESELGLIPECWEISSFKNLVGFIIDNRGKTPPVSPSIDKYLLIETTQITNDNIFPELSNLSKNKYVNEDVYNTKFRKGHPQYLDILFATVGNGIPNWSFAPDRNDICIAQNLIGIRAKQGVATQSFLKYSFDSNLFLEQFDGYVITTAQPSIKISDLNLIKMIAPPFNIIKEWDEILNPIIEQQNNNFIENELLKQTRDYLLPKLISGEIRVKDAAKKVKEVL